MASGFQLIFPSWVDFQHVPVKRHCAAIDYNVCQGCGARVLILEYVSLWDVAEMREREDRDRGKDLTGRGRKV